MSYPYPPPGTPPPPYNAGYPVVAPHATGIGMRSPDQPGSSGSPTMPFDLKRSGSHPHIRMEQPMSADDEAKMANAVEKKRSKLNYHRASTACTCCRRRKIRCEAGSPGQKKCKTCEKLNKECKYQSVSTQGPPDTRHASMSRASAGHRLASASAASSPAVSSGHPVEIHPAQHHGHMTMPSIQHMALGDPPDLKMATGSMGRTAYHEYGNQGMTPSWMAADPGGGSRTKHGSWAPYGSEPTPITPGFPSYNHTSPPTGAQTQGWATAPEAVPRNDAMTWGSAYPPGGQPPFSPISGMTTPTSGYERKTPVPASGAPGGATMPAAEMYPPLPHMDHTTASSSLSPPHGSAPQTANYGSWAQQPSYPPISKPGEAYGGGGGWYSQGESGHAAQPAMTGLPVTDGYYTQR